MERQLEHFLRHHPFVWENENWDVHQLSFKMKSWNPEERKWVLEQLQNRKKAKNKLPTWYACKEVVYPNMISIEQCSSEWTASYKSQLFPRLSKVLDLTMGLGVDAYYFSKHHQEVIALDPDPVVCESVNYSFEKLGVTNIHIHTKKAEEWMGENALEGIELVYIDPSRRESSGAKVFMIADCQPDVAFLVPKLLKHPVKVMLKLSPMLDVSAVLRELDEKWDVYALSVQNECKELLLVHDPDQNNDRLVAVNIENGKVDELYFSQLYHKVEPTTGMPSNYIYLPNSSLLKLGVNDRYAHELGLIKLSGNTNAYTSPNLVSEYSGRVFEVIEVIKPDEKELKKVLKDKRISLLAKNFPLTTEELKKKLKNQESDTYFGLATTLSDGAKKLIVTKKVC